MLENWFNLTRKPTFYSITLRISPECIFSINVSGEQIRFITLQNYSHKSQFHFHVASSHWEMSVLPPSPLLHLTSNKYSMAQFMRAVAFILPTICDIKWLDSKGFLFGLINDEVKCIDLWLKARKRTFDFFWLSFLSFFSHSFNRHRRLYFDGNMSVLKCECKVAFCCITSATFFQYWFISFNKLKMLWNRPLDLIITSVVNSMISLLAKGGQPISML